MVSEFYGNEATWHTLHQMLRHNRAAHGFLFYGEAGLGKKTLANRFMAEMLCTGENKPCGVCKSCKMLENGTHPDVCYVAHSGKKGGFSVETVRQIGMDLATPPNEGAAKFYLFADCDAMDARSQNLLLKSIEEPPPYGYFIFTAAAPTVLLPTVRSRIVSLAVTPVSEPQCREALDARGFSPEACEEATRAFHGNIGKCIQYLENDDFREIVGLTKSAINSIINRNEYELLRVMACVGKEREQTRFFLTLLDRSIRDAMVLKQNGAVSCIGCDETGARTLSKRLSASAGQAMHLAIGTAYKAVEANVNLPLALSALCASCMDAG